MAQYVLSEMHASESGGASWSLERDRLANLLVERRETFVKACTELEVPVNPTHDGFFAWYECDDPVAVAEKCAEMHVYLVPLRGGVRIGLCAIPLHQIPKVAQALKSAHQ